MTKHTTPAYLKRTAYSISLPVWFRLFLPHVDADSSSRALVLLVDYAVRHGALEALAPSIPPGLVESKDLAAYLCGEPYTLRPTPAQLTQDAAKLAATLEEARAALAVLTEQIDAR